MEATPPAETLDPNPSELTGTFLLACLTVLRRVARGIPDLAEASMDGAALGFQETLTYLVVPLAELCHCQGPNQASAIALLLQTSHRGLLPPSTWLHCVDRVRPRGHIPVIDLWNMVFCKVMYIVIGFVHMLTCI